MPRGWHFLRLLIVLAELAVLTGLVVLAGFEGLASPEVLVFASVGLIGTILIAIKDRPWTYLTAGILVSLVPLALFAMFMWIVITNPLGGRVYAASLLMLGAILVALPAGIRGFRHARRNEHVTIGRGWRTAHGAFVIGVTCLLLGAMYGGGLASVAAKQSVGGGADFTPEEVDGEQRTLRMVDGEFTPARFNVTLNTPTEIRITNEDGEFHTFTYERNGQEYNHNFVANSQGSVWVFFGQTGTIKYRCVPHSGGYDDSTGMVGQIEVTI